mgnify:CR=1 FL=1
MVRPKFPFQFSDIWSFPTSLYLISYITVVNQKWAWKIERFFGLCKIGIPAFQYIVSKELNYKPPTIKHVPQSADYRAEDYDQVGDFPEQL